MSFRKACRRADHEDAPRRGRYRRLRGKEPTFAAAAMMTQRPASL
jgi:hypothetical protein